MLITIGQPHGSESDNLHEVLLPLTNNRLEDIMSGRILYLLLAYDEDADQDDFYIQVLGICSSKGKAKTRAKRMCLLNPNDLNETMMHIERWEIDGSEIGDGKKLFPALDKRDDGPEAEQDRECFKVNLKAAASRCVGGSIFVK
jgi:hypothetical protein